ncbi:MAG: hypothetical protein B5M53_08215 [Candidatus Cloacimonas sp. 4484_209]|nr:MAG: hypothetical protein B5M53_08215 [Candidatus Cloacimonas sp. 4484_209]
MKVLSFLIVSLFVVFITISVFSQEPNRVHIVKPGDTLWDISAFYLNNPFLWPSIYQANKVKIQNPHWIYPGQRFVIPPLVMKREKVSITPTPSKPGVPPPTTTTEGKPVETGIKKVESVEIALPMVATNLAFKGGYITRENLGTGYIVQSEPKNKENIVSSNTVYIDLGETDGVKKGDFFTVFRWGRKVKDPTTGKYLGKIVNVIGKLEVNKVTENSSSCEVIQSFEIIKNHDLIMPFSPEEIPLGEQLVTPENPIEGHIVAAKKEGEIIKPFDIVYINLGKTDGVAVGDYFQIIRKGKTVSDPGEKGKVKLTELVAGGLQVLKTTDETSTCYITTIEGNMDIAPGELIRLKAEYPHKATLKEEEEMGTIEEEK